MSVGGKPAHTVVDGQAVETGLGSSDTDLESAPATVNFLSAPPGDPVADARAGGTAGGADAADSPDEINGTAILAGTARLNPAPGSGNGSSGNGNGSGSLRADGEPAVQAERPVKVTGALAASILLPADAARVPAARAWDASDVVTELYTAHYNQLVRLAVMLVHDVQTAEEVVQDAFEAMHLAWRRLRDTEKALSYLRQAIVNRSRSVLRHRKVVEMHPPKPAPDEQSAEHAALTLIERSAVTSALRSLPVRQREAVILRYYGDFSEADIAKAMGISRRGVKTHTARAMAALKSILERET
jgi:RNA polymerase sigma-70 factor (sigma-E family)